MHHYDFHIGDYMKATSHLSNDEDLCYRRLLDMYYDTEKPIPLETDWVSRRLRLGSELVTTVLNDFFIRCEDGWHSLRCDEEIARYHAMAERARSNGKAGGRPKKTQSVPTGNPVETQSKANQEPGTKNQREVKQARATRLPSAWVPSEADMEYCRTERPDLVPEDVAENFRDYWMAIPGTKGAKLDWSATWRTWVRRESAPKRNSVNDGINFNSPMFAN